jgi:diacylglycerol kinase (ATP)
MMNRWMSAFSNSFRALARGMREEPALKEEIALLLLAVPASFVLTDDGWRRAMLLGVLLVLIAIELLNTAVEKLCDRLHPGQDEAIGYVKDLGSAAVLMGIALCAITWLLALWQFVDRVL